jgi:hypothetical protein
MASRAECLHEGYGAVPVVVGISAWKWRYHFEGTQTRLEKIPAPCLHAPAEAMAPVGYRSRNRSINLVDILDVREVKGVKI